MQWITYLVGGFNLPLCKMMEFFSYEIPNFLWKNNPFMFQTNQAVNNISGWWMLVVYLPLWKIWKSVGVTIPTYIYIYPIKIPFNPHLQKAARRRRSPLQNPQAEAAQVLRAPGRHNEGTCAAVLERCEKGGFHRGKWWKMPFFCGFTSKKWWTCGFWMVLSEKHMMNMWISRANCHENWDVTGQKSCTRNWFSSTEIERCIFWNMVSVAKIPSLAEICSNWDFPFNNHGMLAMSGQKWKLYQQIWRCTKRNMDFSDIKIYPSELQWIYLNLPHKDGSKSTSGEKKHMSSTGNKAFLGMLPLSFTIWVWVKTNSTPVVHIKIAGIYGCE